MVKVRAHLNALYGEDFTKLIYRMDEFVRKKADSNIKNLSKIYLRQGKDW